MRTITSLLNYRLFHPTLGWMVLHMQINDTINRQQFQRNSLLRNFSYTNINAINNALFIGSLLNEYNMI